MEQKESPSIRKKRINIQRNIITAGWFACIAFVLVWSVHAASMDIKSLKKDDSSSVTQVDVKKNSHNPIVDPNDSAYDPDLDPDTPKSSTKKSDKKNNSSSLVQSENSLSQTDGGVHPYTTPKDTADDLSDALFIGDSRTVGLQNSCEKPKATFYCAVGLNISSVMTDKVVTLENGTSVTVVEALKQKPFKRIYINFGTNELGWPYIDSFTDKYKEFIAAIKQACPDAEIYAESILPFTAEKDAEGDAVNNINAVTFNAYIQQIAKESGANYLDCTMAVKDEYGNLPADASTDGIHLVSQYCNYWLNYIIDKT